MQAHRGHNISEHIWENLKPHLPGCKGCVGVPLMTTVGLLTQFFWILRTGAPWRGLPPDYGDWKNTHRPMHLECRWRDGGV